MPAEGVAAPEDAVEIDVDDVEPMLIGDVFRGRFGSRDASVADEDVGAALFRHDPRRRGVDLSRVGDFHLDDVACVAFGFHRRPRLPSNLEIAVRDIDVSPRLGERFHAGEAKPLRAAGDDRDAAFEIEAIEIHGPEASAAMPSAHPLAVVDK